MVALLSVLVIIGVTFLVTRVATVALTLTGMSRQAARFQARSALTGAGFTTTESETVVGHPVRRRIVMGLMLIGSAGIVTAVATLAAGFATGADPLEIGIFLAGLALMLLLSSSRWFDRAMQPLIARLVRRFTDLDARDYAALLQIHGDYAVTELAVAEDDWLAHRTLQELRLADEGVLVLGVQRDAETYVGAPRADVALTPGDTLILYGHAGRIRDLGERRRGADGDRAHVEAIADQRVREIHDQTVDEAGAGPAVAAGGGSADDADPSPGAGEDAGG